MSLPASKAARCARGGPRPARRRASSAPRAAEERRSGRRAARPASRLVWIGLATKASAPDSRARSRASSVEMTHTGMWRVATSFLRRSRTRQPSMSGRKMSSVRACGLYSRAMARAAAPSEVTSPLKPFSRAVSSRKRAKPRSFSTISSTRSPGSMWSRSSPTSLIKRRGSGSPLRRRLARHAERRTPLARGASLVSAGCARRAEPAPATRRGGTADSGGPARGGVYTCGR